MKCPVCTNPMRRIGVGEEYIEITTEGKALKKLPQRWVCVNQYCSNFAGNSEKPNRTVQLSYKRGDKVVIESDSRPDIDFSAPSHVELDEAVTELPIKTDLNELARKIVMEQFTGKEAMQLASELADKAVQDG